MNIIVSTHDPLHPVRGGGALRTLKVAEEFKRRGHNVMIIAPTDGTGELGGIKVHWLHAPRKQRSQILSSLKFNVRLLRKFLQFVRATDMFFIHNTISAATIPFLKPFFRFTFVLDITDVHAEYLTVGRRNIVERLLTPVVLFFEYRIIKAADRVIVVTLAMKRLLVAKGIPAERISVVYDGAETGKIPTGKEPGAPRNVIHFGTVDRQHGVEHFIEAVPLVLKEIPEARFLIVGGGRELGNVRKKAVLLGVADYCLFTDYLPCDEARRYLTRAAIGVIPRPDNLPNRIVTTLKLYEYWASGTAVVSSRLEGIAEIAADGRDIVFFAPGSATDLASKIVALMRAPAAVSSLRNEGMTTVKKFSWQALIPAIVRHALE